ncbi:MAG: molybdate ABC transporter substrate-binding protein [Cytophagales bacterium]|nr:molybdate ABC transporter substrate-binding protein [Cytophagales bacterium]
MIFRHFPKYLPFVLLMPLLGVAPPQQGVPGEVTVAAASDLRYAMDSLAAVFRRINPNCRVTVIYGSSGKFFAQIVNGGPFDLFFSADEEYPRKLQAQKLTAGGITPYATGRLVLWSRTLDPSAGLKTLLGPAVRKIAIANPDHAPYGKRAVECLQHYKLYDQVKDRLVLGENIAQAAQFATTGAADAGLLALSLAVGPGLRGKGKYYVVPAESHTPLVQAFVRLRRAENNAAAQAFATYVTSPPGRKVLQGFGFTIPE